MGVSERGGWEGIVYKRKASRWRAGERSNDWRKRKVWRTDDFVVGRTRAHDLRHVAASSLIAGGLSVAAVQAVLGHSSPAETLEVYTHLWPTDEEKTRQAIEQASAAWLGNGTGAFCVTDVSPRADATA